MPLANMAYSDCRTNLGLNIFMFVQVWTLETNEPKEVEEVVEDTSDRSISHKQVIVTEVSTDELKFYAQYVDNGKE